MKERKLMRKLIDKFLVALIEYNDKEDLQGMMIPFLVKNREDLHFLFTEVYGTKLTTDEKGAIIFSFLLASIDSLDDTKFVMQDFLKTKDYEYYKKEGLSLMKGAGNSLDQKGQRQLSKQIKERLKGLQLHKNDWVKLVLDFKEEKFTFEVFREKRRWMRSILFKSYEEAFFVFIWAFEHIDKGVYVGDIPINACKKRFRTKPSHALYRRIAALIKMKEIDSYSAQLKSVRIEIQNNDSFMKTGRGVRLLQILENL